ncbi:MAG: minor capsid protein [Clostridium sp.]
MKNKDYWKKRSEQIAGKQFDKTDRLIQRLKIEHQEAYYSIQKDIEVFYQRFAENNEITLVDARKLLNSGELNEFRMSLRQFIRLAKDNENLKWDKELNNVYFKTRVTRLQALQYQIRDTIENLFSIEFKEMTNLIKDTYEDTYYRNIYEVQKGLGIGINFAKIDEDALKKVINEPWLGSNFSSRIWTDKDKLIRELEINLSQAFIRGDSIDRSTQIIADKLNVANNRARTLVNTESANIVSKATFDGYKASGVVKEYEVLATLDLKTSEICRDMDGKVFKVTEKQIGLNAPPFHCNCRTTTVAYFDDAVDEERIARDSEGNSYYVDGNMKYGEWYTKYVKGDTKEEINEKKIQNKFRDKEQYEKYKEILGKQSLKSFDKFQDLKYNNVNEWENMKKNFNTNNNKAIIQQRLDYVINNEQGFIPTNTRVTNVKIIAGNGSEVKLRSNQMISDKFGGEINNWSKKVGKIESEKYIFDVHWNEYDGKQYIVKIKNRKEKRDEY